MPAFFGVIVTVVLGVLLVVILGVWGLPFTLLIALAIAAYLVAARRRSPSVGAVESGRAPEPTGMPRSSSGGAETANERVGQR